MQVSISIGSFSANKILICNTNKIYFAVFEGNRSQNYFDDDGDVITMPRPACTTVKTVPKKGSTALGKNQPRFIDGDLPPRQTLAPQHGRDTCTMVPSSRPEQHTACKRSRCSLPFVIFPAIWSNAGWKVWNRLRSNYIAMPQPQLSLKGSQLWSKTAPVHRESSPSHIL